jgi:hypothetical protein
MFNIRNFKKTVLNKITLIDLILIFFGILVVGFLLFHFYRKRAFVYIDLTFQRQDWSTNSFPPEYWEVNKLNAGDVGYNSVGNQVTEIQEIEKNVWDGGTRLYVEIAVKVDAVYNTTTRTYVYDGNPLLIGEELTLKFNNTSFTGVITNVYKDKEQRFADYQQASAEIKVRYRNYEPWHAEAINNFTVTNSKGKIILKTKEVKITPAEMVVVNDRGDVLLRWDPLKKDVTATFELPNVLCANKLCYYNRYQTFMVGEGFWADSGQTYLDKGSVMSATIKYKD